MSFRKIQFPGKTLVVTSLDRRYDAFVLYFLKLWSDKFSVKPDVNRAAGALLTAYARPAVIPEGFFRRLRFLWQYKTVVFLNPDPSADRPLKWLAKLMLLPRRAGFAERRRLSPFNYSFPFNTENHHFIHQARLFFEYLTGEKILTWQMPDPGVFPPTSRPLPSGNYGVLAVDLAAETTQRLAAELQKFINLTTRNLRLVLIVDDSPNSGEKAGAAFARKLSMTMTEKAVKATELVLNPTAIEKQALAREAEWVTGTDAEALNLAALAGIPSLSFFGPLNERVWQPFSTRARVMTGEFSCRPCAKFPGGVDCKSEKEWQCVSGITAELILATLNGMSLQMNKRHNSLVRTPPL